VLLSVLVPYEERGNVEHVENDVLIVAGLFLAGGRIFNWYADKGVNPAVDKAEGIFPCREQKYWM